MCFSFCFIEAQKVKAEGSVKKPTKSFPTTFITLIDTNNGLTKFGAKDFQITSNNDVIIYTDENGYFSVDAKPSDSLLFKNNLKRYYPEKYAVSDVMKNKNFVLEFREKPCISEKECDQKKPSRVYAFIGKKINVSYVDTSKYCDDMMNSKYKAQYAIEKEFGEHYPKSTIEFTAYDHNTKYDGLFFNYENVLIYVGEFCGELIYLRENFFPVYKTKEGRWAIPVYHKYNHWFGLEKLTSTPMTFDDSLTFDIPTSFSAEKIEELFPKKDFKIENGKAYPLMGRYVEDLVKSNDEILN